MPLSSVALAMLLSACAASPTTEDRAALAAEARKVAGGMQQRLAGKLLGEIKANGPEVRWCRSRRGGISAT
jgi:hypothetical protein